LGPAPHPNECSSRGPRSRLRFRAKPIIDSEKGQNMRRSDRFSGSLAGVHLVAMCLAAWGCSGGDPQVAAPVKKDVQTADLPQAPDAAPDVAQDVAPDVGQDIAAEVAPPDVSGTDGSTDSGPACECGDGKCDTAACGETSVTCPTDCNPCGDGVCSPGEGPIKCPTDCCGGCGDGKCTGYDCGESPATCGVDCGTKCGNTTCDKGENPENCKMDCVTQVCGNNVCEPEDGGPDKCPGDCGKACGNCVCDKGEDFTSCPVDCGFCGDGICSNCANLSESATACTVDCKANCQAGGCDDGVGCTSDVCGSDGLCVHVPNQTACDDGNLCTDDACEVSKGCTATANFANCSDGNLCTTADACAGGTCKGDVKACDDNNACTGDSCKADTGNCVHLALDATCTDDNPCTEGDICTSGKCAPGKPANCGDGNLCTDDACAGIEGCTHVANCNGCSDGNPCSVFDTCAETVCVGQTKDCQDSEPCTADSCKADTGACLHLPQAGACEDGNACTLGDKCGGGKCLAGAVTDCNDEDDCTGDLCDPTAGCSHIAVACAACTPGAPCTPTNPCHTGTTDCESKKPLCFDTSKNLPDDTACGESKGCVAGACTSFSNFASVFSGDGQTGFIDAILSPVVIKVTDAGNTAVANAAVTVTVPNGANAMPLTGKTNSQGKFTFSPRLGRAPGAYEFSVKVVSAAPLAVQATATDVDPGTTFTLLNADHSTGKDGVPGPATAAHVGALADMTLAPDGTIYVADPNNHRVLKVDPTGTVTLVAGTGASGATGDGGPAIGAKLSYPSGVALDDENDYLYIADTGNDAIRIVDLQAGTIDAFAGGGTAGAPGYGDGNPANAAVFNHPMHVFKGPDHGLYVADSNHNRIRRIDLDTSVITNWAGTAGNVDCSGEIALHSCGGSTGSLAARGSCVVTWDAAGNAYIGATLCGKPNGGNPNGIVKRAPDGTLSFVAGKDGGVSGYGGPASQTDFASIVGIALDAAGNIYGHGLTSKRIWRIDRSSGAVQSVLGTDTAGYAGDYVPASQVQIGDPRGLVFDAKQNLYFTDALTYTIREVAAFGQTKPTPAVLSLVAGDGQQVLLDQSLPVALQVKLTDDKGVVLVGYPIAFDAGQSGAAAYTATAKTGVNGTASTQARVGLAPGDYAISASFKDLDGKDVSGSPVVFTAKALAPDAGTIFTIVNGDHASGNTGKPGNGVIAHVGSTYDFTTTADGTTYFVDFSNHQVNKLTPSGYLTTVAGTSSGYFGDGGPAVAAKLSYPMGVAYQADTSTLYIADTNNNVIRTVGADGIIGTFAGGGGALSPGWGDSGPATSAVLNHPTHLTLGPDNALYVADHAHSRIRRIDLATTIITNWVGSAGSAPCTGDIELWGCSSGGPGGFGSACAMAWDGAGNTYISGTLCGKLAPSGQPYGIIKRAASGTLTHIAGANSGKTGDGIDAKTAALNRTSSVAVDESGNVYYAEYDGYRIRKIGVDGLVSTVSGTGVSGYAGDYVPWATAQYKAPGHLQVLTNGHLLVSDSDAFCLRMIW